MLTRRIIPLFLGAALLALIFCCGTGPNPNLATPESTAGWYMSNAARLKAALDPIAYGNIMGCFSDRARSYFGANYKELAGPDHQGELNALTGIQRETLAFQVAVMPAGPMPRYSAPEIKVLSSTENSAEVSIDGKKISMIKEQGEWRIDDLFGLMR